MSSVISFDLIRHMNIVPVEVNGKKTRFILDLGIGLNLISKTFAETLDLKTEGAFKGKRMSGQEVSVEIVTVPSISFGELEHRNIKAGIFDMSVFPDEFKGVDGILSPTFLLDVIFTIDGPARSILMEKRTGDLARTNEGTTMPVQVEFDGLSTSIFIKMKLPTGKTGKFELDTGSDILIINSGHMEDLGIKADDPAVRNYSGMDETGHTYNRYVTGLDGSVCVDGLPRICQKNPEVMFQDIIYDGLVGNDFLKRYVVTYDLKGSRISFRSGNVRT